MIDPTSSLDGVIAAILRSLAQWGGIMVFGTMFLDCLPFMAFVAPGVIMLVLAGFVASSQPVAQAGLLFGSACAGALLSDTLMYFAGRSGYGRVRFIRRMVDRRDKLRSEILTQRTPILIFYQFPPYSRMFAPLIMGAVGFSWSRWVMLVSASTLVFVASFFGLGLAAGIGGHAAAGATKAASIVSALFVFAFLGWLLGLVLRLLQRRRDARSPVG
jgi:membrane protein DedA with SNARE-associated domain